jgi:hypothetical protein
MRVKKKKQMDEAGSHFYVPESCIMRGKEPNLATARKPGPLLYNPLTTLVCGSMNRICAKEIKQGAHCSNKNKIIIKIMNKLPLVLCYC